MKNLLVVITFAFIACSEGPVDPSGSARVNVVVTVNGFDHDPDGVVVGLGEDSLGVAGSNDSITITAPEGTREIMLRDVAHNCTPAQPTLQVTAASAHTVRAHFVLTCARTLANKILFTSFRNGDFGIFAMQLDGNGLHQVPTGGRATHGTVTPDGRQLIFSNGSGTIYEVNADGTERRPIVTDGYNPALSRDGRYLSFTRLGNDNQLLLLDRFTGQVRALADDGSFVGTSALSPNATRVAYTTSSVTQPDAVVVRDLNGGEPARVSNDFAVAWSPTWTPDHWITFTATRDADPAWRIYSVNPANGTFRAEPTGASEATGAAWSPDGEWLAFMADRSPTWNIYIVSRDGAARRQLTDHTFEESSPFFGPQLPQ